MPDGADPSGADVVEADVLDADVVEADVVEADVVEADVVEHWAAAMFARDAASRALGMQLLAARPGRAVLRMTVRPDMVQGHGSTHGGIVFALADSAFAFCCNGPGRVVVAASADVTFVAATRAGDVLVAEAVEETRFGRNGVSRVRVVREGDGELVALFQGRSRQVG